MATVGEQSNTNTVLIVIALLIAIPALIVSILAYNRAGRNLDDDIEERLTTIRNDVTLTVARTGAAAELAAVRTRVEAEETGEEIQNRVSEIRNDLQETYRNVDRESSDEWQELNRDFDQILNNLNTNADEALSAMQRLIDRLR